MEGICIFFQLIVYDQGRDFDIINHRVDFDVREISILGRAMNNIFRKKNKQIVSDRRLPRHIAFIMDGNGRWAKKRGLPRNMGHREGSYTLKRIAKDCSEIGIQYVSVFALSTENWSRPKEEVAGLLNLLREFIRSADKEIAENNIRIRFAMSREGLPEDILSEIDRIMEKTKNIKGTQLIIALNYGGKDEIVHAVKRIAQDVSENRLKPGDIDQSLFSSYMYLPDVPEPDMIIRPSGEKRISNFYLWQAAYSEFWYSDVLWPDFDRKQLEKALEDYEKRDRRYGGISNENKNY